MRLLVIILLGLLAYFQYEFWWGKNGFSDYRYYQQVVARLKQKNAKQTERNNQMFAQIRDLKEGVDAIEEQAREDYSMIKADETFYRLMKNKPKYESK